MRLYLGHYVLIGYFLIVLTVSFSPGCCDCSQQTPAPAYNPIRKPVIRVLMHEPSRISILVQDEVTKQVTIEELDKYGRNYEIIADVEDGQPMWAELPKILNPYKGKEYTAKIHIRSGEDINGAGWNHGKFGSGTTTIIK